MAEGVDFPSIRDGSDADYEFTCTPCGEDNIREEAVKYCPECREYLCTTCTRHHGRQKLLRSHKLVDTHDAKKGSVVAKATKCRYHSDRDIEMYCGTHDMVYCTKCIATDHRSCSTVDAIENLNTLLVQQDEKNCFKDETGKIEENFKELKKKKQENLESLEEQRNVILKQIEDAVNTLTDHIRKLEVEITDDLSKKYTEIRDELRSDITGLDVTTKEVEECRKQLDIVASMDVGQQFVQMKLIQNIVNDAKDSVRKDKIKENSTLTFTESLALKTNVIKATSLGQVQKSSNEGSTPTIYKVNTKKEIDVKMPGDRNACLITDVCQLHNGTILLTDWDNKKLKRLDKNYNVRDHCDLDASPAAICCTGQNEVAVKMNNNKVQFIAVGISFSYLKDISIQGGKQCGMTNCGGELWVSSGTGVNIYSLTGVLLATLQNDLYGMAIFKGRIQHMAVNGKDVIVTDSSNGAVCVGRDGSVKQQFRDERLTHVRGVSISDSGTVFLSGFFSDNIMMFGLDGKCLRELVPKSSGLVNPVSLFVDRKKNCLLVTCDYSDKVNILLFD